MKDKYIYTAVLLSFLISGCIFNDANYDFEYDIIVTDTPTNLKGLNTLIAMIIILIYPTLALEQTSFFRLIEAVLQITLI